MRPSRFASLLAASLLLIPQPPAQPDALSLDGLRDAEYVLIAEDVASDLPVADAHFAWADLRRLYAATDADYLYVYVDLPNYSPANAAGEIGLAVVISGTAAGPRSDPLATRASHITYAYTGAAQGTCEAAPFAGVRHPEVLFRGEVRGPGYGPNASTGILWRAVGGGAAWDLGLEDWGGFTTPAPDRIAYAEGDGVELSVPWSELGLAGPTSVSLAFLTTAAGLTPGILDVLPPDPAATAAPTSTVLSQLAALSLPLPPPASVAWGCGTLAVAETNGPAQLSVQLHSALTQTVSVSYTTTALTAGPADFTPVTGTVTFAPGLTRQTIPVAITNDTAPEDDETFLVTLSSSQGASLTAPSALTVTITDDDDGSPPGGGLYIPIVLR